jgi:Plavaka transposase
MHTNLRVRNAHTSRAASPIQFFCPQCDRTFLSIRGRKQHIRAIHPLPTGNANPGNVSLDRKPSPSPPGSDSRSQASSHSRSPSLSVDIPSPIGSGSPSLSDTSSSFSCVCSSSTHLEQHGTPSIPSTRNYRITVEDITDDESEDDVNASQRFPSSHSSYDHFYFGEESSLRGSGSGRDTPSVHSSKPTIKRTYHSDLTGKFLFTLLSDLSKEKVGLPCDNHGAPFPSGCPPSPQPNNVSPDDWTPYKSRAQFELAELLYTKAQMSARNIDQLMKTWAAYGNEPPFLNHKDLYKTIDATVTGYDPWQSFPTSHDGEIPQQGEVPSWMTAEHTVWFRDPRLPIHNILSNPDFKDMFDTSPYQEYDTNHNHRYHDFMSGNWAWRHAVSLSSSCVF